MPSTSFDIFRYQPDVSDEYYRQEFTLEHAQDATLLDAIAQCRGLNQQRKNTAAGYVNAEINGFARTIHHVTGQPER